MNEQQVRQLIRQELARNNNQSRFNLNTIPNHTHNGTDSQPIKQENIIPSVSVSGSITMAQETTYTLNLNASFTPSHIMAYGVITGSYSGAANRIQTIGSAQLTPSFYFQTGTDTTVVTGDIQYPFPTQQPDGTSPTVPMQSSSYISVNRGSLASTYAGVSEDHIVDVVFPDPSSEADIKARVTVVGYSKSAITLSVPYLESGWTIFLNVVVS